MNTAIARLKQFEPPEGYYVAFSGGKDSVIVADLCRRAGVKHQLEHAHTTVDYPELVYFIRNRYPHCHVIKPALSMWQLIRKNKFPPTRRIRYCCRDLKEIHGKGRIVVTGVRWAESRRRKNDRGVFEVDENVNRKRVIFRNVDNDELRRMLEFCHGKRKHILNPIIDWEDAEVWKYITDRKIEICSLYHEGFKRIGCIGCPMSAMKIRVRDFARYPTYQLAYMRTFDRVVRDRIASGNPLRNFKNGAELFEFWVNEK